MQRQKQLDYELDEDADIAEAAGITARPKVITKKKRSALTKQDAIKSYRLILIVILILDAVQRISQHDDYNRILAAGAILVTAEFVFRTVYARR